MFKMQTTLLAALVTVAGLSPLAATSARADGSAAPVASAEIVQYRLEKWRTMHLHDAKKVEELVATLKKMRCEVKTGSHGDHTDVRYRCPKWHQMEFETHEAAHQWESWLKKLGFETKHSH